MNVVSITKLDIDQPQIYINLSMDYPEDAGTIGTCYITVIHDLVSPMCTVPIGVHAGGHSSGTDDHTGVCAHEACLEEERSLPSCRVATGASLHRTTFY